MKCEICNFVVPEWMSVTEAAATMQAHVLTHIANSLNKIAEATAQMVGKQ